MRISEIVNTVAAYRALGMLVGKRAVEGALAIQTGLDTGGQVDATDQTYDPSADASADTSKQDSVDLSTYGKAPQNPATTDASSGDDSLGAIIETLQRQKATVNYTMPGIAGVTGPMNMTYEVEQMYHVIQFVPRSQLVDTQA